MMKLITPYPDDTDTEYLDIRLHGHVLKKEPVFVRYIDDLDDLMKYADFIRKKENCTFFNFGPCDLNPGYYVMEY
jgi:hypothetical protein